MNLTTCHLNKLMTCLASIISALPTSFASAVHRETTTKIFKNLSPPHTLCMGTLQIINIPPAEKPQFLTSFFLKLNPQTPATSLSHIKPFCITTIPLPLTSTETTPSRRSVKSVVKASKVTVTAQLKENWLHSLTYPFPNKPTECPNCAGAADLARTKVDTSWAIGVDPDLSGALAVLKINASGCSAEVFDAPHLKVMVGERLRKRLDAKAIVQLLQGIDAPFGTTAYIEQSIPYPKDGKQGWWSGGFGYGLWIGILVASGFSVVPIPSFIWKREFELTGAKSSKDDSRRIASTLFPSLSSSLRRKRDHGRAEALLIAAYGKGLKINSTTARTLEELP